MSSSPRRFRKEGLGKFLGENIGIIASVGLLIVGGILVLLFVVLRFAEPKDKAHKSHKANDKVAAAGEDVSAARTGSRAKETRPAENPQAVEEQHLTDQQHAAQAAAALTIADGGREPFREPTPRLEDLDPATVRACAAG